MLNGYFLFLMSNILITVTPINKNEDIEFSYISFRLINKLIILALYYLL
jgi:hypothetical protein